VVEIIQTGALRRAYKKLHPNQKAAVDDAVAAIAADPTLG
jgi:mRNA interferase RelE/StbE